MPVTLDTGAELSVLPEEAYWVLKFTGEKVSLTGIFDDSTPTTAPLAKAELTVGSEVIKTIAAMVSRDYY